MREEKNAKKTGKRGGEKKKEGGEEVSHTKSTPKKYNREKGRVELARRLEQGIPSFALS